MYLRENIKNEKHAFFSVWKLEVNLAVPMMVIFLALCPRKSRSSIWELYMILDNKTGLKKKEK